MSAHTSPNHDLTGKNIRSWFVVAYAGKRDGVRYWRCMCRHGNLDFQILAEKVITEQEILDPEVNTLFSGEDRWWEAVVNPIGWIYGQWTVIGPAGEHAPEQPGDSAALWKCRCICGKERDIPHGLLYWGRNLSCGCRPDAEVRAELLKKQWQAKQRYAQARAGARRRLRESKLDKKWTRDMERSLRNFQPACVLCKYGGDPTTHHVRPLSNGSGKKPGNVVRLCRFCNSKISSRSLRNLPPEMARALKAAAAQFKEFWESGCAPSQADPAVLKKESPKAPDPALVALLRAVECGDDGAIATLATWLEKSGDPRAPAIWDVARLKVQFAQPIDKAEPSEDGHPPSRRGFHRAVRVTIMQRKGSEVTYSVDYRLDGKWMPSGPWTVLTSAGDSEDSLRQQVVREVRKRQLGDEVWHRLGLSVNQWSALSLYLGIDPMRVATSIEQIAQWQGARVQTIQKRIDAALYRLTVPSPYGHQMRAM
jgi:5-methylcytosine-specific restriction endonuclease McrA